MLRIQNPISNPRRGRKGRGKGRKGRRNPETAVPFIGAVARRDNPGGLLATGLVLGALGVIGYAGWKMFSKDEAKPLPGTTQKVWSLIIMDSTGTAWGETAPFIGVGSSNGAEPLTTLPQPTVEEAVAAIEQMVTERGDLYTWPATV